MDDFTAHSGIERRGDWGGTVRYGGGDQSMVVMFYMRGVQNPAKSQELGRPYLEDKIYVRIHPPGERLNIVDREATDVEKRRYPMQWQQFRDNAPQVSDGTPIDMLFPASPATAGALKASGVHTVEQCAKLSAHAIENIGMGCQQWVNEAQRYLEVANKGVKASQLKAIVEEKDREINSLKNKVNNLEAEISSIQSKQANAVTVEEVQRMLAQAGGPGARGVYPPGRQLAPSFDAQTEQINATHSTKDLSRKAQKSAPTKRSRARIQ